MGERINYMYDPQSKMDQCDIFPYYEVVFFVDAIQCVLEYFCLIYTNTRKQNISKWYSQGFQDH